MAAALLDTTVLIDVLRGRSAALRLGDLRSSGDIPCACAINVEEVVRGLRASEADAADRLFRGLRMIPLAESEGRLAGSWRRDYAERGITLSQADCMIGAAARLFGARVCTGNPSHFPMPELTVEHWPVGT
jgi:predicted nucleic acid-binding protein